MTLILAVHLDLDPDKLSCLGISHKFLTPSEIVWIYSHMHAVMDCTTAKSFDDKKILKSYLTLFLFRTMQQLLYFTQYYKGHIAKTIRLLTQRGGNKSSKCA